VLFLTYYMGGRVAASDDLEEVAWLLLEKVLERVIPEHKVLVEKIIEANKRR
jgi:hypothetical protein